MAISVRSQILFWTAQVLGATATILILIWATYFRGGFAWGDSKLLFNIHAFLMLVGLIVINGEGIMSMRYFPWRDEKALLCHMLPHMLSFGLGIIGINAAFKFHNKINMPHLSTFHSWLGIAIFAVYAIVLLYSIAAFYFPAVAPKMISQGLTEVLLKSDDNKGRIYGFQRYFIPAESRRLEELNDPPHIQGYMRFLKANNARRRSRPSNDRKEQIASVMHFYEPDAPEERREVQGRMFGISRFYDSEENLAPVDPESVMDSIEDFKGTLDLTDNGISWHAYSGYIVFVTVLAAAFAGFYEMLKFLRSTAGELPESETYLIYSTACVTFLFGIVALFTGGVGPVTIGVTTYAENYPSSETTPLLLNS